MNDPKLFSTGSRASIGPYGTSVILSIKMRGSERLHNAGKSSLKVLNTMLLQITSWVFVLDCFSDLMKFLACFECWTFRFCAILGFKTSRPPPCFCLQRLMANYEVIARFDVLKDSIEI